MISQAVPGLPENVPCVYYGGDAIDLISPPDILEAVLESSETMTTDTHF